MDASLVAHGDLPFRDPLSPARVDEVLARLEAGSSLLDIGCGPGELHRRAGFGGVGLDLDPDVIAEARRRAPDVVATHPEADDARAYGERARARVSLPEGRGTIGFALVLYRLP